MTSGRLISQLCFIGGFVAAVVLHKDKGLQYGDEVAYRFEARVFLHGRLAADAPPMVESEPGTLP
jgi:hypothetical protein